MRLCVNMRLVLHRDPDYFPKITYRRLEVADYSFKHVGYLDGLPVFLETLCD